MPERHRFAVILEIETSDPRLSPAIINDGMPSAKDVARTRRALLQRLPKDVQRVVAIFPVEHAKMLMMLHEAFGDDIAKKLGVDNDTFVRPPPDYVPPTRE
jgi:hypothetical protein